MKNNDFQNEDKENIIIFIKKELLLKDDEYIIEYEKLLGFSNNNYIITIKDKLKNKILKKCIYRRFGKISQYYDKKLEILIIKYLYQKGFGPNILYENKTYRISEFLYDAKNLDLNNLFDELIINSINKILNIYNSFSHIYKYEFNSNKIILKQIDNNESKISCETTHYNNIMKNFYERAKLNFKTFENKFNTNLENNIKYHKYFKMIHNLFQDFESLYKNNIPKEGIMVLNHNDCFSLNIMIREKDHKMFLIDNEYASLNLLGYDISYYICESHFNYENIYNFSIPKIDINKCFNNYYMKYLNKFESFNKNYLNEYAIIMDEFKKIKYFIKLCLLTNLFLFIYVLCYVDYDHWKTNKYKDFYFSSGIYRVNLYNYFKDELGKIP